MGKSLPVITFPFYGEDENLFIDEFVHIHSMHWKDS